MTRTLRSVSLQASMMRRASLSSRSATHCRQATPSAIRALPVQPSQCLCSASQQPEVSTSSAPASQPQRSTHAVTRRNLFLGLGAVLAAGCQQSQAQAQAAELVDLIYDDFKAFDQNRDGRMDTVEMQDAFKQVLGADLDERQIREEMIPILDFNNDGQVSTREEFLRAMSLELEVDQNFWNVADTDRDGTLSLRELRSAVGDVGGEAGDIVLRVAFRHADRYPRDGRLNPQETSEAMDWLAGGVLDRMRLGLRGPQ